MANRPKGYGMTAELANKTASKWDPDLSAEIVSWMQQQLAGAEGCEGLNGVDLSTGDKLQEVLKDGTILCKLINALKPGSVKKVNTSKMAFKQMENIGFFLSGCEALGVNKTDTFQTVDLYENQNMPQVITGLSALGRKTRTYGPKESVENKREFTEEQLKAGQNVIGLQMGSNKGATQAGQNFGKSRSILQE